MRWVCASAGAGPNEPGLPLRCALSAPAQVASGQPVPLRFRFSNAGREPLRLLLWGTPFEGWLAPFVQVERDGQVLAYGGAQLKRGAPVAEDWLRIAPGRARLATVDLAEAFDLHLPGRYTVRPRLVLHGLRIDGKPAHEASITLDCNPVHIDLRP